MTSFVDVLELVKWPRQETANRWNHCRQVDVLLPDMDDKTLNLWRQIESSRRRGKKRQLAGVADRTAKPGTSA